MSEATYTIRRLMKAGFKDTALERILDLGSGQIERWLNLDDEVPPEAEAVFKIIDAYPWILTVADANYRPEVALRELANAASRVRIPPDWDRLEEVGHNFVQISGMTAGRTTYYCENCGALMIVSYEGIEVWHVPWVRARPSQWERILADESLPADDLYRCEGQAAGSKPTLKEKFTVLDAIDAERLSKI